MSKVFNIFLFGLILLGATLALFEGLRQRDLRAEHTRLTKEYGYMPVGDRKKIHLVALPSNDPLHFRWRIYFPANYKAKWRNRNGYSSGSSSSSRNFIAQIRFRFKDDGELQIFHQEDMGSGVSSLGNRAFSRYLQKNWDKLKIHQAGTKGIEVYDVDQVVYLFKLNMPDEMATDVREKLKGRVSPQFIPIPYSRTLGTDEAVAAEKKRLESEMN